VGLLVRTHHMFIFIKPVSEYNQDESNGFRTDLARIVVRQATVELSVGHYEMELIYSYRDLRWLVIVPTDIHALLDRISDIAEVLVIARTHRNGGRLLVAGRVHKLLN